MPKLLTEIYRLQRDLTELDKDEQLLVKMFANLLEGHYNVPQPQNRMTFEEYEKVPGRWELVDGLLQDY
jgi:hypothetical protein